MPVYKGTTEVTSGNLYKGTTEIENGYKATSSFYVNLITIEFTAISGQGLTYTLPATRTGDAGVSYPSTTFTIAGTAGQRLNTGSFAMTNLPATLSAAITGGTNTSTLTVTITGTFPASGVSPITSVVSGVSIVTTYSANFLIIAGGGPGGAGYVSGGGGAGGLRTSYGTVNGGGQALDSELTLTPNTSYTISIGVASTDSYISGSDISTITATYGSGGGSSTANGVSGGNAGSYGYNGGAPGNSFYSAGGGGGAGAAAPTGPTNGGGCAGAPLSNSITGTAVDYAAGGVGYTGNYSNCGATASTFGEGGNAAGGTGGTGGIIIRVPTASYSGNVTGTYTTGTDGTDTWIRWTVSGTYIG